MAKKISNQLVLLSSAAIVSIYGVGFLHTEAAADKLAAADTATTTSTTTTSSTSTVAMNAAATSSAVLPPGLAPRRRPSGGFGDQDERRRGRDGRPPFASGNPGGSSSVGAVGAPTAIATSSATTSSATTASRAAAAADRDGTYTGTAENRHGDLTVTVVIQGGRIASADISDCGMQYPCSRIADLPGEAVQRQSADVDQVTGATYSWMAYHDALTQALAKAHGAA